MVYGEIMERRRKRKKQTNESKRGNKIHRRDGYDNLVGKNCDGLIGLSANFNS